MKILLAYLVVLSYVVSISCSKCKDEVISSYPTDYFEKHVPEFVNNRPTFGIVAMEVTGQKQMSIEFTFTLGKDFLGASFVKLIESAGGRAVPILEDISHGDLNKLLHKINGVILPGGDTDISDSGYERISKQVMEYSKNQAKKNIIFPILGICRGAQMMMIAEAGKDFLAETDSSNYSIPLEFTKDAKKSRLFGHAPKQLIKALSSKAISFNAHTMSIPTLNFYNNTALTKIFRAISTNYDRNGTEFISTYEGINAPLYGLQWHPEKVIAVFNPTIAVDHTIYSMISAQYIANFVVSEARKNPNKFRNRQDEESHLMMAHPTQYIGNMTEAPYEQIYLFDFQPPFQEAEKKKKKKKKGKSGN